jgi:hypothetical protein
MPENEKKYYNIIYIINDKSLLNSRAATGSKLSFGEIRTSTNPHRRRQNSLKWDGALAA